MITCTISTLIKIISIPLQESCNTTNTLSEEDPHLQNM